MPHGALELGPTLLYQQAVLVPQILKIADQPLQIRLAISLHGATDEVREKIMPINKKYPIAKLFEALR